jgi:hypothetical protein
MLSTYMFVSGRRAGLHELRTSILILVNFRGGRCRHGLPAADAGGVAYCGGKHRGYLLLRVSSPFLLGSRWECFFFAPPVNVSVVLYRTSRS